MTSSTTPTDPTPDTRVVHLRLEGVSIVLDLTGGRLPSVAHWGADLGDLDAAAASALVESNVGPVGNNEAAAWPRLALLPEQRTGWLGRPGLCGSREGRAWSPDFVVEAVELDDGPVTSPLTTAAGGRLVVTAVDATQGLQLVLELELEAGGLLRTRATVTNQAPQAYTVDDLVVALPVPPQARELLDFAGRWGKERTPQRTELVVGTHVRENRKGRTGADAATVLHLGVPGFGFADGEIWAVHTGWSGNHTHYAERQYTGTQVIGGGELLLPGEVRLEQGQSYGSPWTYFAYGVGLDQVARRFHRWLRARPQHVDAARPVTLNVWEAVYFDHDLARLTDLAERAAALGVERYVLDDGWFGSRRNDLSGLGDWTVSPDAWPDGLGPLVDTVTGLGMQFGLWFEPEMVNPDSDVARAHPEWIMSARPGGADGWPVESRNQQVINLGIPECYAYIRDAMLAVLDAYDIAYLKWDHNRDLIEAGTSPGGEPGVHAQTLATYRLIDELKAAHPGLEIESCSSGGARVDLGILERTDRVWVSDCIDPLDRCQMNRWTTQLIPPELMGSHIASGRSHTTGRIHTLAFRAATALFGHLGIEWDLATATKIELAELGEWIAFYQAHRELLLGGDLVRVDHPDPTIHQHGVVASDRHTAIFSYTPVSRSEVSRPGALRFPGLHPDLSYTVQPIVIGERPHGLNPPSWWHREGDHRSTSFAGTTVPATVLMGSGLQGPGLDPEQAVLFLLTAQ